MKRLGVAAALVPLVVLSAWPLLPAQASKPVGMAFPPDFPVIKDASLGVPVIGFGSSEGPLTHTPVIFLHGNNDTPYPTTCNGSFGHTRDLAQYFHDHGYALKELWGLGYQGDQCDLLTDQSRRSAYPHSTVANVPDLRAFVAAVLTYTGATQVDIIGHSLGGTVAREWMRQDNAYAKVRKLVAVDSPHHGIINCSPSPLNYYVTIGFNPNSEVCKEYGSDVTPLLTVLNAGDPTPGPTEYMTIRNADTSFVYFDKQDGSFPPVPAQDREGKPHDFSQSARLDGAVNVDVQGQGRYDNALLTAHLGILNSPEVWKVAFDFLSSPVTPTASAPSAQAGAGRSSGGGPGSSLPATGGASPTLLPAALVVACVLLRRLARS